MMPTFGNGIDVGQGMSFDYEPRIDVTQTSESELKLIQHVDRQCHEYELTKEEIRSIIKSTDSYSVQLKLEYKLHGWCHFCPHGTNLVVHRLAIVNDRYLKCVVEALWKTVTYTPKTDCSRPLITMFWQEYAVDHFLFKHLLATGWAVTGLNPKMFFGYGEWFDGVKMERQF